ncbi:MAG: PKD domain-containing protein [Filimonas sp.]|nr:PKD domain-containing protein [Filimonas sp.]
MKQLILFICIAASAISCTKKTGALETPIPKEDVNIIVQETGEQNVYRFINARIGQTATARWDLGNGQTANGDTVIGKYPFKGDYTVSLTIFNGVTAVQKTTLLSLNKDNVNLDSVYVCLTGGPDSLNGKTWVIDSTRKNGDGSADLPVKIINGSTVTPKDYTNTGLYNSSWTFWLQGSKMTYKNNGYSLCHSSRIAEINSIWGAFTQTGTVGGDPYGTYTPKLSPQQTWTMSIKGGLHYIQMQGGAFIMFYRGCADVIEYQVSVINKNEMVLTHYETSPSGRAGWSDKYYLVRKGYVR